MKQVTIYGNVTKRASHLIHVLMLLLIVFKKLIVYRSIECNGKHYDERTNIELNANS